MNSRFGSPNARFLTAFGHATNLLTASGYYLVIQQHRDAIKHLQVRWATPLASAVRYDSRAKEAVRLAENISGQPPIDDELQRLPPVVCNPPSTTDPDEELEEECYEFPEDSEESALAPEAVVLGDVLDGGDAEEEDTHRLEPAAHFRWQLPAVSHSTLRAVKLI